MKIFEDKLSSDLDSDPWKTSKKPSPKFFPRDFGLAKILRGKNRIKYAPSGVLLAFFPNIEYYILLVVRNNRVQCHHCCSRHRPMCLLSSHSPFRCFPCQPKAISTHEAPRSINEATDDLDRTCIEVLQCRILGILESFLVSFTVAIFAPAPVLQ